MVLLLILAKVHRLIAHNSKDDTFYTGQQLHGYHLRCNNDRHHYTRELVIPIFEREGKLYLTPPFLANAFTPWREISHNNFQVNTCEEEISL